VLKTELLNDKVKPNKIPRSGEYCIKNYFITVINF